MADKPKKSGRQNYPWGKIKHYYVTSPDATLRKVAEKYGISYTTVAKKSKADNWFATRNEHQLNVVSKAISKTEEEQAAELSAECDYLQLMKGHLGRMLNDQQQFQRHLVEEITINEDEGRVITTSEEIFDKFDSRAMKDAMQTLKMIEDMSRSLYNIAKASEIQKRQLDAARLKLEQDKFEFEKNKANAANTDNDYVIRIEGFEEGWDE